MDMAESWRIAIAQINCTVGDLKGNSAKIVEFTGRAKDAGADIVTFPELAITGYPPEDLLLKPKFIEDNIAALREVARSITDVVAVVGFVDRKNGSLYNAASVMYDAEIKGVYRKTLLPENVPVFGLTAGLAVTLQGLVGLKGKVWGVNTFGYSAPYKVLDEKLGFTAENVYRQVKEYLAQYKK